MRHLKRITTNVRALWAIPHVLREISKTLNEHHKRNQSHERRLAKISAGLKETERRVSKLSKTLDTVNQKLTQDRADRHALNKRLMKWRRLIRGQMSAVVRRLYMPDNVFSDLLTIKAGRFQLHSQHEEDGILMALFSRAGATSQRFVEIGCGRSGGNAAMFVKELGWTGLMLDASKVVIKKQRSLYGHRPGMVSVCAKVTPETINEILANNGFDGEVDLFSIDIDSYEYWVLDRLEVCRPRVLVVEYNALFGPTGAVTVPYKEFPANAPRLYRGASLAALEKVACGKGYRLVFCEDEGCNAFFLRDDVATDIPCATLVEAFRPNLVRQSMRDLVVGEGVDFFEVLTEKQLPLVEV